MVSVVKIYLVLFVTFSPRLAAGSIKLHTSLFGPSSSKSTMTSEEYQNAVVKAKEHILAGDIFQIVLSQRFERRTFADPFEVYRALRIVNPSPYMTYLQVCLLFSKICSFTLISFFFLFLTICNHVIDDQARGCILVASSPEILTRVKKASNFCCSNVTASSSLSLLKLDLSDILPSRF